MFLEKAFILFLATSINNNNDDNNFLSTVV